MKTLLERINSFSEQVKGFLPDHNGSEIIIANGGYIELKVNGFKDYKKACRFLRALGVQKWDKKVFSNVPEMIWTLVSAQVDGITLKLYVDDLPPTCRIVEKEVKIPKSETKETGEFITIKQKEVVCGA